MSLHAVGTADDQDSVIQHLEGAFHLGGKVYVARGIQQGQFRIRKPHNGLFGEYGNAPCPFQGMGIQKGVPVIHPARGTDGAGAVEQCLAQCRFSSVHMCKDADGQLFHGNLPVSWAAKNPVVVFHYSRYVCKIQWLFTEPCKSVFDAL